jgi:GT2 family glycosyltransferase
MSGSRGGPAAEAYDQAQAALAAGDLETAQRLLEYAQRLAPSDGGITLSIGSVRLQRRDPTASEPFELIAQRDDVREAWLGLAATRRLIGQGDAAAAALGQALARHAPPLRAATLDFHDAVARDAGADGWCGLSGDGELLVALTGQPALPDRLGPLAVRLDGRPVPLAALDRGRDGRLRLALPDGWQRAERLTVSWRRRPLIGSPVTPRRILRVEGFVTASAGGLEGWAWLPGDCDTAAVLTIRDLARDAAPLQVTAAEEPCSAVPAGALARPRGFRVPAAALARFTGAVEVVGRDGRQLYGSPLEPGAEARSAAAAAGLVRELYPARRRARAPVALADLRLPAVPADMVGPPPTPGRLRRRLIDVIIPVYRGVAETLACIDSVLADPVADMRVVVVEDASPDAALVEALRKLAAKGRIVLRRQPRNRGFPATANAGMAAAGDHDVVLLNSDTLVPPGWLARLQAAALSEPDIGTVTPLSNDATILSYPAPEGGNPVPDAAATSRLDAMAQAANGAALVEIPSAIGFCMYIRRDCLDAVGLLREDVFAQGYGEENDFCLRARHLGYRHVAATGVFVGHVGGHSFGAAKQHLIERNLRVLNRLHPGYDALVEAHLAADPLAPARRRMDAARWRDGIRKQGAVILVTHDRVGGVKRRVMERCAALRADGLRPIVLTPLRRAGAPTRCLVDDGGDAYPNLRFEMPQELDALAALLRQDRPSAVELHHFIGHDPAILSLAARLGLPCDVVVHDYAWFCPRITLVAAGNRYCGEPALAGCEACYADLGGRIDEAIAPTALVARSRAVLAAARRVITPSPDAARRLCRHFPGVRPEVQAWEDDAALPALSFAPARDGGRGAKARICVVGAIGPEKGYDLLLACARDAVARRLPLAFTLVGYSCDDARLLATGAVTITGPYEDAEAVRLIRAARADAALLPSVWPETWSYVLTQMWQAGLPVLAFDLGAPAERIRAHGRGWTIPLGLSAAAVNDALQGVVAGLRAELPAAAAAD